MDVHIVSIAAQAAFYSVFVQSAEESGASVPLMETVRGLSPTSRCMTDIVQAYGKVLKAGIRFGAEETWKMFSIV